jgi:hypothetical protein
MITINQEEVEALATQMATTPLTTPDWRLPVYPATDDASFVQFIGVQNAINFCFTDPVSLNKYAASYQDALWSGATGACAALMRAVENGVDLLDTSVLAALSLGEARHLFVSAEAPLPMLSERVAFLNSLYASLEAYDDSFANLVEAAGYDALEIENRLVEEFPAFAGDRSIHPLTKEEFVFNKRARLFAIEYEGRARASNGKLPTLSNVDLIGPVVDYQLPRALRAAGALVYDEQLAEFVDGQRLLAPGSVDEIEIRLATDQVVRSLLTLINQQVEVPVSMVEVDFALWVAGRKAGGEHHLTYTTNY